MMTYLTDYLHFLIGLLRLYTPRFGDTAGIKVFMMTFVVHFPGVPTCTLIKPLTSTIRYGVVANI